MTFTEEGLVLGAGTVLAKASSNHSGRPAVAIDNAEERVLALLAVAYGKDVDPSVLDHIRRASEEWSRGEPCLALLLFTLPIPGSQSWPTNRRPHSGFSWRSGRSPMGLRRLIC